jgi:hypothetical protein
MDNFANDNARFPAGKIESSAFAPRANRLTPIQRLPSRNGSRRDSAYCRIFVNASSIAFPYSTRVFALLSVAFCSSGDTLCNTATISATFGT